MESKIKLKASVVLKMAKEAKINKEKEIEKTKVKVEQNLLKEYNYFPNLFNSWAEKLGLNLVFKTETNVKNLPFLDFTRDLFLEDLERDLKAINLIIKLVNTALINSESDCLVSLSVPDFNLISID
jgi:hypothetical protein